MFSLLQSFKMVLLYKSCYCSVCEKEFKDANALSDHERQVHTEENETCKICGKLETNSYTLYGHMQNHETKICQVCNENLPKKNFARHMEKHNEVVYSCEICNLNFTRKDALKRHKGTSTHKSHVHLFNLYFHIIKDSRIC